MMIIKYHKLQPFVWSMVLWGEVHRRYTWSLRSRLV